MKFVHTMLTSNLNGNEKVNDLQSFEWWGRIPWIIFLSSSTFHFWVLCFFISIFGCICRHRIKTNFALKTDENIFHVDKKIQFEVLSSYTYASIPNDDSQTTQQRQNVMLYGLSVNDLFMDLNFWAYFDRFALKILIYSFNSVFFFAHTH